MHSWLLMEVTMVNKLLKILVKFLEPPYFFSKPLECSLLLSVDEIMMLNKYCKCISLISNSFEKWGGTKYLTKILSRKRAIILRKTLTDL